MIICDICGAVIGRNNIFTCTICDNYNLCQKCEDKGEHPFHDFLKSKRNKTQTFYATPMQVRKNEEIDLKFRPPQVEQSSATSSFNCTKKAVTESENYTCIDLTEDSPSDSTVGRSKDVIRLRNKRIKIQIPMAPRSFYSLRSQAGNGDV
ncbi:uncharacterized protein LOC132749613 isoform X2 [Ruditapes philippinarum]|uniref:uncharacterized protein LOC132749613 isoform X2 n=1 Tax=Ruditapes philippinarum TaxID=129788 RepID=UPI00295B28EC|nr:uncharacterized protein LOC132749613 isoform X2 [Ruditapes philippinarum]